MNNISKIAHLIYFFPFEVLLIFKWNAQSSEWAVPAHFDLKEVAEFIQLAQPSAFTEAVILVGLAQIITTLVPLELSS